MEQCITEQNRIRKTRTVTNLIIVQCKEKEEGEFEDR